MARNHPQYKLRGSDDGRKAIGLPCLSTTGRPCSAKQLALGDGQPLWNSLVEPIHRNSVPPKHIAVYVRFGSKADIRRARPQYDDDTGRSKVIIKKKEDSGNY